MDPRIADFIRDNRRRYTREAIRQQLIEAGHDPAAIDATWAALDAPDPDATAGEGFWGRFSLFLRRPQRGGLPARLPRRRAW